MKKTITAMVFLCLGLGLTAQQWGGSTTTSNLIYRDGNVLIGSGTALSGSWGTDRVLQLKGPNNAALSMFSNTYPGSYIFGFFPQFNYSGIFSDQYPLAIYVGGTERMRFSTAGAVTVGTVPSTPAGYKLYVESGILTERLKVAIKTSASWSDYVFEPGYKLQALSDVDKFIKANKHLPGIPSAANMVKEGLDVAAMDAKLLEKIEELTLHLIQLNQRLAAVEADNKALRKELSNIK